MTEDESLSSRDPQDDNDTIMDEFDMMEQFEKGNFWGPFADQDIGDTRMTPRTWQCSDTRLQHQEADQHEDPAGRNSRVSWVSTSS